MGENISLERRIQRLEDIEAIKKLMATYGNYCDKGWKGHVTNFKEVASLFAEDATWECPEIPVNAKGRQEISKMLEASSAGYELAMHSFTNPIIDIDGDKAKAKWLVFVGGSLEGTTILT